LALFVLHKGEREITMGKKKSGGKGGTDGGQSVSPASPSAPGGAQAPPPGLAKAAGAVSFTAAVDTSQTEVEEFSPGQIKQDESLQKLNETLRKQQDEAFKKQQELTRDSNQALQDQKSQLSALKQQGINTPLFGTLR
jgi:hypothetical protein